MTRARETEADRLRRCRLMFERGYAGLPAGEARKQLMLDEIEERRQRIAAIDSCGRAPAEPQADEAREEQPRPWWWQQGQFA